MLKALLWAVLTGALAMAPLSASRAHGIYTGVQGRDGRLCCGGNDCAATTYREQGGDFEFLPRESRWVKIPPDRITFLPVPGDSPSDDSHHAHLCYRPATQDDQEWRHEDVFGDIYLYCAFIPPGAI